MKSKEAIKKLMNYLDLSLDSQEEEQATKLLNEIRQDIDRLEIYEKFTIPNLRKLILKLYNNEELTREENEIIFDIMSLNNEGVENE